MGYITWVNPDDENATVHYNKSTVYFTNRTTDRLMLVDLTDYLGDTEVQTSSQAQILVDGYTQSYAKKMQKTHNKAYTTETVEAAPTWYDPTSGGVPLALCDTVTLNYEPFGIEKKVKVVATEYDVLVERYSKITLGDPRTNFVDTYISNAQSASAAKVTSDMYPQMWKNEIQQATKSIANLGERINGNGSSITLSSGTTATDIASFTLTKGKWMVTCTGRFEENGTGNRMVRLASSSGGSAINYSVIALSRAASAGRTYVQFCAPITVSSSSSTYYIVGYQTSGGNLDVIGRWDAIRIL